MSESDKPRQKYMAIGYPFGTAVPTGIPSGLETDPEVSAKRTAEMQQLAQPHEAPFKGNLTIIWEQEKTEISIRLSNLEAHALHQDIKISELIQRLDTDQKVIEELAQRVKTLEQWALQREPVTSEIPVSEHPLYKKS